MTLLIGGYIMGLILALVALGVLISFRVLAFRDLTVDGSFTLGGAVAATMLVHGAGPAGATATAFLAGMAAGAVTGILHTKFQINGLLAGILVMTALYSINLHVMGKSNVPLSSSPGKETPTIFSAAQSQAAADATVHIGRYEAQTRDLIELTVILAGIAAAGAALNAFFRTNLGLAMRAAGDNAQMIRALGVDVGWMNILGLALSNGLVALSGACLVQHQGFADVQMGIGMVVWGFASVIIGETLVGARHLGLLIIGVVMGSVLFRLLVSMALKWGMEAQDLKLVTAAFVLAALVLPDLAKSLKKRWLPAAPAGQKA
ncbi:MAG: ABC transporter permease [Planctomycetia bacterium]|nr:ABC transporter permease [Planctomycetia bacterium]